MTARVWNEGDPEPSDRPAVVDVRGEFHAGASGEPFTVGPGVMRRYAHETTDPEFEPLALRLSRLGLSGHVKISRSRSGWRPVDIGGEQ